MDKLYKKASDWLDEHDVITSEGNILDLIKLLKEHEKETIIACQDAVNILNKQMDGFEVYAQIVNDRLKYIDLK